MGRRRAALVWALLAVPAVACTDEESSPSEQSAAGTGTERGSPARRLVIPLQGRPSAVAYADGALWVADDERGVVQRLDPADGEAVGEPVAVSPHPTSLSAGEGLLWVTDAEGTVTALDTRTGQARHERLEVGGVLVTVAADRERAWVGDIEAGTVRSIDAATGQLGRAVRVPAGVVRLELVGQMLWVSGLEATVTPVRTDTLAVGEPAPVGQAPIGMVAGNGLLWVANSDSDSVSRLDLASGERRNEDAAVGDAPIAIAMVGDEAWVLDQDGASITRLDAHSADRLGSPLQLPARPRGLAVSPAGVWVVGVDPSVAVLYVPR